VRPEGNSQEFEWSMAIPGSSPRFDDKSDALYGDFPGLVVCQASVGQGALCPTRVHEVEGAILVSHVESRGFYDIAVQTGFKSPLLAPSLQKVVDCSHQTPAPLSVPYLPRGCRMCRTVSPWTLVSKLLGKDI